MKPGGNSMKKRMLIVDTFKGMFIGACMLVPGVSGGTIAIVLDVYDKLISSVSSFFKDIKGNLLTLLTICGGAVIGIVLFSKAILFIVNQYTFSAMYLFLGAVLGSIPLLFSKAKVKKFSFGVIIYPLLGASIAFAIELIPKGTFNINNESGLIEYLYLMLAGVILSIALVLPGISVSYMLLILGIYESTLMAIENLQLAFLLSLVIGIGLGVILSTKLLESAMKNHPKGTYLLIIGFVLFSVREIFPGMPTGTSIISCLITFGIGFGSIFLLSRYSS